jgi:hypothetical protein
MKQTFLGKNQKRYKKMYNYNPDRLLQGQLNKILKKLFKKKVGFFLESEEEKEKFLFELAKKLNAHEQIHCPEANYPKSERALKRLTCDFANDKKNFMARFYIFFDAELGLSLLSGEKSYRFSTAADILQLFEAVTEAHVIMQTEKAKNSKITQLKIQAIYAAVAQIAAEENFVYMLKKGSGKLFLYIRLSKWDYLQINISFKDFQNALQSIVELYRSVKVMYDKGIKIAVKGTITTVYDKWQGVTDKTQNYGD